MSRILPTVWNALEHVDGGLSVEIIVDMLAEEFNEAMIRNSTGRIEQAIERVCDRLKWQAEVAGKYVLCGKTISEDGKGAVLRALSTVFERGRMRDVYNALKELGEVGDE